MNKDMDLTEKYFDAKFDNLNDNMSNLSINLAKVADSVERIDGKVAEHGVRLSVIEGSHKDHIDNHKESKGDKKFNIEMWIIIIIFAVDLVKGFFPTAP